MEGPSGRKRFDGFYDGDNTYRVRYLPMREGEYSLTLRSIIPSLNGQTHTFTALPALLDDHGPVNIKGVYFSHADDERFFVMGTTAYVWHHRPADVRAQSLKSFSDNGFNKIQMLFFPKHYTGSFHKIDVSYSHLAIRLRAAQAHLISGVLTPRISENSKTGLTDFLTFKAFAILLILQIFLHPSPLITKLVPCHKYDIRNDYDHHYKNHNNSNGCSHTQVCKIKRLHNRPGSHSLCTSCGSSGCHTQMMSYTFIALIICVANTMTNVSRNIC